MRRLVRTAHSDYVLDDQAQTLIRTPREADANQLRSDGEVTRLLEVITLERGVMAEFLIQIPGIGAITYRRTTAVEEIEDLP